MDPVAERRLFLASLVGLPLSALHADRPAAQAGAQGSGRITREMLVQAARVADVSFTDSELDAMVDRVNANLRVLADLHALQPDNSVAPPLYFNPVLPGMPIDRSSRPIRRSRDHGVRRPASSDEIAYLPVTDLAELIRTRRVTALELTRIYLDRLKRYGPRLQCVVTLTEDRAVRQAEQVDKEIASGRYRGLRCMVFPGV